MYQRNSEGLHQYSWVVASWVVAWVQSPNADQNGSPPDGSLYDDIAGEVYIFIYLVF